MNVKWVKNKTYIVSYIMCVVNVGYMWVFLYINWLIMGKNYGIYMRIISIKGK